MALPGGNLTALALPPTSPVRVSGVSILTLPAEILHIIFRLARRHEGRQGVETIKNARLTCRDFHDISSEYLLSFEFSMSCDFNSTWTGLNVEPSIESLERLKKISEHQLIGKGINAITVDLAIFKPHHINDFEQFLSQVELDMQMVGYRFREDYEARTTLVRATCRAMRLRNELPSDAFGKAINIYEELIKQAYQDFREKAVEQQALVGNGTFVQALVAAVSKMPRLRSLVFKDRPQRHDISPPLEGESRTSDGLKFLFSTDKTFRQYLSRKCCWAGNGQGDFGSVIPTLLAALDESTSNLTSLFIHVTRINDMGSLRMTSEQRQKISRVVKGLHTLVICQDIPQDLQEKSGIEIWQDLVSTLTSSKDLQEVILYLGLLDIDPDYESIYPVSNRPSWIFKDACFLGDRNWPRLEILHLQGIPLQYSELEQLAQGLGKKQDIGWPRVRLQQVHLTSGSWTSALDLLRDEVSQTLGILSYPSGAEFENAEGDDLARLRYAWDGHSKQSWDSWAVDELFPWLQVVNNAERYIDGKTHANPLKPSATKPKLAAPSTP